MESVPTVGYLYCSSLSSLPVLLINVPVVVFPSVLATERRRTVVGLVAQTSVVFIGHSYEPSWRLYVEELQSFQDRSMAMPALDLKA